MERTPRKMKLLVSSLLLLVSLASAERTPYVKVLYDDGYHLAEGHEYNLRQILLYHEENVLKTLYENKGIGSGDSKMDLKLDLLKESGGFAIEAHPWGPEFDGFKDFCKRNSSEQLKPLIHSCNGIVKLRLLTIEERERLHQFKNQQKVSRKPYEVIYDHGRITTKLAKVDRFSLRDYVSLADYNIVIFGVQIKRHQGWTAIDFEHKPYKNSFVIEPAESNEKCGLKGLEGLGVRLERCSGEVRVVRPD